MNDRDWMKENLTKLRTLRDEIRLELHLARMEAKERWRKLEPVMFDAEKLAEKVTDTSKRAVTEVIAELKEFQEHLRRHQREEDTRR